MSDGAAAANLPVARPVAGSGAAVPFRRVVFYVPGFDPFPPRRYRELYRREAAAQAEVSGHAIAVRALVDGGDYGWQVTARIAEPEAGGACETEVRVLAWSDIVRRSMGQGIAATYGQLVRTAWIYLASGAFRRLMRLRRGPILAALYPIAMLMAQAVAAAAAGAIAGWLAALWLGGWGGLALGAGVAAAVLRACRAADHRLYAYYLMHDYAFTAGRRGAYPAELDRQIDRFAARVGQALAGGCDEVLVVGHSSGAHVAVSVVARLLRAGHLRGGGPALALLTLGQVIPMVSFLPRAQALRADLHDLAADGRVFWRDVSAPGDGCCFALCDPVAVSGVAPGGRRFPLVVSAAFSRTLAPERWQALRRRYFRLHFQYLCAFDRPGDYDYFRITAGPLTLAQRDGGRAASTSRIETPLSPFCARDAGGAVTACSRPNPPPAPTGCRSGGTCGFSAPTSCRRSRRGSITPGWPNTAPSSSAPTCATTPIWSPRCWNGGRTTFPSPAGSPRACGRFWAGRCS